MILHNTSPERQRLAEAPSLALRASRTIKDEMAVRIFKERHLLGHQFAEQEQSRGDAAGAVRFQEQADQAPRYGDVIQQYILGSLPPPEVARLRFLSGGCVSPPRIAALGGLTPPAQDFDFVTLELGVAIMTGTLEYVP
jgi:hypothetical protein